MKKKVGKQISVRTSGFVFILKKYIFQTDPAVLVHDRDGREDDRGQEALHQKRRKNQLRALRTARSVRRVWRRSSQQVHRHRRAQELPGIF